MNHVFTFRAALLSFQFRADFRESQYGRNWGGVRGRERGIAARVSRPRSQFAQTQTCSKSLVCITVSHIKLFEYITKR